MQNIKQQIQWLLQEKYHGKANMQFKKDVKRLEMGEPLDHIIGFVEFLDCKILVDKNVLIPRFETEFWVEQALNRLKPIKSSSCRALDMFSGSGCIGIAVAKHIPKAQVFFCDSSSACVSQIRKNIKINGVAERCRVIRSDIFSYSREYENKFDYIFANPPYIPTKRKSKVQESVLEHEPHAALFGGGDGLLYIRRFLAEAKKHLKKGGCIFMEFDPPQKPAITRLLQQYGYQSWQFRKDQYGKWRWLIANGK